MREALKASEKVFEWRVGDDEAGDYDAILSYLDRHLRGGEAQPALEETVTFGFTLTAQQARDFQKIVDRMREDTKVLTQRRMLSAAAVRREVGRIIDRRDGEVRALVSDEQWGMYDEFKPSLVEQLEAELDIVRVQ